MALKPNFLSTGIGSMPFTDAGHAIDVSLQKLSAPIWPQLPKLGFREQMEIQYSEGMPCVKIEEDKGRMYFDTSGDYSEALAEFYINNMDANTGEMNHTNLAISPNYSKGIYALEQRLKTLDHKLPLLKVQTTGPCSFALTIVDETKRAIYYNEEFRDIIVKTLAMKCRWQIEKFQPFAENIICFIDEPILSAFGSSTYVSVKRPDVVNHLSELIGSVHAAKALAGIHCCGNTEWSILIDAGVDIVNFDAFSYGETIAMYPDSVKTHLQAGGILAWGIVPTSAAIREQTVAGLAERLEKVMDNLAGKGISKQLITEQAILTPSCGTGSLDPSDAEKVFDLLCQLTVEMRQRYGY
jgi:hypothetical protein